MSDTIVDIMGYKISLKNINNPALNRVIKDRIILNISKNEERGYECRYHDGYPDWAETYSDSKW